MNTRNMNMNTKKIYGIRSGSTDDGRTNWSNQRVRVSLGECRKRETNMGISRALVCLVERTKTSGYRGTESFIPKTRIKANIRTKYWLDISRTNEHELLELRPSLTHSRMRARAHTHTLKFKTISSIGFLLSFFSLSLTVTLSLLHNIFFLCSMIVIIITMCVKWWGKLSGLDFHWLNQNRTDSIRFDSICPSYTQQSRTEWKRSIQHNQPV